MRPPFGFRFFCNRTLYDKPARKCRAFRFLERNRLQRYKTESPIQNPPVADPKPASQRTNTRQSKNQYPPVKEPIPASQRINTRQSKNQYPPVNRSSDWRVLGGRLAGIQQSSRRLCAFTCSASNLPRWHHSSFPVGSSTSLSGG